ncbi:N-acetyltransferase [bacterium]|nr:N-acetyltransferase [bacterium]
MRKEPPEKVSQEKITFDVRELEPLLSPPLMKVKPFAPAWVRLKNGENLLIRPAKKSEAPLLLNYVKKMIDIDHDFYDIVGVRVCAEILGWYRNRLKDPYQFLGLINGEMVGFVNGRLMNEDINISLHTMAFKRGLRIGAILYYAKCEYAFETLKQKEFWATYESYNGLKRWGIGMAQPSYPWPDYQHELGGARVFYMTQKYWSTVVKQYLLDMIGTTLKRPVPKDLLRKNVRLKIPREVAI